jgi:hypothetical protein
MTRQTHDDDVVNEMVFNPDDLIPAFNLGPLVYESNTLTYQMFGFKGPLWMTQTCNNGSGCPFVQVQHMRFLPQPLLHSLGDDALFSTRDKLRVRVW